MQKTFSTIAPVVLLSASMGVILVLVCNRLSDVGLPQPIYSAISVLYLLGYAICLYIVFVSDRVKQFKFGWAVLLFFFGKLLFPIFWHRHVREPSQ